MSEQRRAKTAADLRPRAFEDNLQCALKYAFRLLGYRDRSEKEMCERLLRKGFSEKVVLEAVDYLKDKGFINDRRFAEILRKEAIERKHLGKTGARHYLINKGIAAHVVEDVLGGDDDYLDAARSLVERKLRNVKDDNKDDNNERIKRRLWGMLLRRGFSYDTINRVLKSYEGGE